MKWTNERPDDNGIYWHKQPGMSPEMLLVRDGDVFDFGDNEATSIGFFDGRGEWLGPITPEQAQRFDALREAAEDARAWICRVTNQYALGADDPHDVLAALRRALGREQSEVTEFGP